MDLGLTGKTALVLGAGGGLGSAIAAALYKEGANVVIAGRSKDSVQRTVTALSSNEKRVMPCVWDLSDLRASDSAVTEVEEHFGGVDILINNTGGPPPTAAEGQDAALWEEHFRSMVLSVVKLTDRVLPGMRQRQWGRIITSTSSGTIAPIPNLGLSNALRLSLVGWSKTLAREVARDGITCNIVVPGRIATSRIKQLDEATATRKGRSVAEVKAQSAEAIPLGRYGDPAEYGMPVAFLASTAASYITGTVLRVDGGLIASV